jgi:ATP-dependent DNA helicase PIF1
MNSLQQDDYQVLMNYTRTRSSNSFLLGIRELDLAYTWPETWLGFPFMHLLSWIKDTKQTAVLPAPRSSPINTSSFLVMQQKAYTLVHKHTFKSKQSQQLLMVVLGTAGTGKSFLINAIRQLFGEHDCSYNLKITAPTRIAAANIQGSTIYSLIPLLQETITGHRLHALQIMIKNIKLLVIDEYSFLSVTVIDKLDCHLRKILPHKSNIPFGNLNILLCGDPAQLPPVVGKPLYAYQGSTSHLAARYHLFDKVVELDHVFRQRGNDQSQVDFHNLLM